MLNSETVSNISPLSIADIIGNRSVFGKCFSTFSMLKSSFPAIELCDYLQEAVLFCLELNKKRSLPELPKLIVAIGNYLRNDFAPKYSPVYRPRNAYIKAVKEDKENVAQANVDIMDYEPVHTEDYDFNLLSEDFFSSLNDTELAVLVYLLQGLSKREITDYMHTSPSFIYRTGQSLKNKFKEIFINE